jgi:hypothetical protein
MCLCLYYSSDIPFQVAGRPDGWWTRPVWFSDWRNVPAVDFATNVPVSRWYSGKEPGSYRPDGMQKYIERARMGPVTIGMDYYATNISLEITPPVVLERLGAYIDGGGVIRLSTWMVGDTLRFELVP